MERKYFASVFGSKEALPVIRGALEEKLKSEGISERVQVFSSPISYVDYGVNPLDDSDCRPYIKIRDANGNEIFQTSDVIIKTCFRDIPRYVGEAIHVLREYMNRAA